MVINGNKLHNNLHHDKSLKLSELKIMSKISSMPLSEKDSEDSIKLLEPNSNSAEFVRSNQKYSPKFYPPIPTSKIYFTIIV
jgi:hypothetical protein